MTLVADVLNEVERLAPPDFAFSFDKIGLQIGDPSMAVSSVTVSLDPSQECVQYVKSNGSNLLVSHHPVIWDPLKSVRAGDSVFDMASSGVSFIAAHTNWDCAVGGINDVLANILNISGRTDFGESAALPPFKLVVFVPIDDTDRIVQQLSEAGAGQIGDYAECAFQITGVGMFRPGTSTNPSIGEPGRRERVAENRVEMRVPESCLSAVLDRLRAVHPYEEPAFDVIPLKTVDGKRIGRIGNLDSPMTFGEFQAFVDSQLGVRSMAWQGHDRMIERVAVVGGAAPDHWTYALQERADLFLTGEVPHHISIAAAAAGIDIVAAGHFATENPGMREMARLLDESLDIPVHFFEPDGGASGHPL